MIRRALAVAVAAAMLNLITAGAAAVCASHGDHTGSAGDAVASADGQTAHTGHRAHADLPEGSPEPEQCETPTGSDCCPVAVTCAISFGALQEALVTVASAAREAPPAAPTRIVYSPNNGPEPPPPRALGT